MEQSLKMNSIFNDLYLVEKFQKEFMKVESQLNIYDILNRINQMCNCCRNRGFNALVYMYDEVENKFLKDMIYLLSKIDSHEEIPDIIFLLKPRMYNCNYVGVEYVESILYYESLLMILDGEMPELVRLRVANILAMDENAKSMLG